MVSVTRYMTVRQAAGVLALQPRTVARWCREGKVDGARKIGRVWRIPYDSSEIHLSLHRRTRRGL